MDMNLRAPQDLSVKVHRVVKVQPSFKSWVKGIGKVKSFHLQAAAAGLPFYQRMIFPDKKACIVSF